jgi:hypothetical protein
MANVTVKLLTSAAGENFSYAPGDEIQLPADEAKRFLDAGLAEPVAKRASAKAEKRVVKNEA